MKMDILDDPPVEVHPVLERTSATLSNLKEGCKLPVNRNIEDKTEWTPAEILSIRNTTNGLKQFYVHYVDFNKRLDEWVAHDRLDLSQVQFPPNVRNMYFKTGNQTIFLLLIINLNNALLFSKKTFPKNWLI
jgi:hypothetical protein